MRNLAVLLVEILAITSFSFWAVAIEGSNVGKLDTYNYNGISANFLILYVTMPLFLLVAVIAKGFDSKFIGTLIIGALIGGILQDFTWFVINPAFGIQNFNSKITWTGAAWIKWINFGVFEVPNFYVYDLILILPVWFVFIKNYRAVDGFYKTIFRKNQ